MEDVRQTPDAGTRSRAAPIVLAVCRQDHPVAQRLTAELRRLGSTVVTVPDVYEAVVTLARRPDAFAAVVAAVDFLDHRELRFFSLLRRRRPSLLTVAVAQPGFVHKTALAELAGAQAVCTEGRVSEALRSALFPTEPTTKPFECSEQAEAGAGAPIASGEARAEPRGPAEPEPTGPIAERQPEPVGREPSRRSPQRAAEATAHDQPSSTPRRESGASSRDVLTEEEIRALMEDMDEEDLEESEPND